MAIVREFRKPDLFITMTCNSKWTEITSQLLEGQTAQDRPEIVSRVFRLKYLQFIKDIVKGNAFGKVSAWMYVIEWQKRGLPHCHLLVILANQDRLLNPQMVDGIVSAELPPDPSTMPDEDSRDQAKRLEEIVIKTMIHGPCGETNRNSPCMLDGKCQKSFPKPFVKETVVDPEACYALYRRRSPADGGRVVRTEDGKTLDNSWVVPYNPFFTLRYAAHINVEVCASVRSAKYLFKYVTKGSDRAMVSPQMEGEPVDEIQQYEDLRSCGSSEAAWHLFSFKITERSPSVTRLRVHLEEGQNVQFDPDSEQQALENQRDTELTAFFDFNALSLEDGVDPADLPKYVDMPKGHTYCSKAKKWTKRKRNMESTIGRVHSVNPVCGDVYFLRILLHDEHCQGKVSFADLLTVPGKTCETFQEVCFELGLLSDDQEWQRCLQEAAGTRMCPEIRQLFIIILTFCFPANPRQLFDNNFSDWTDDFERKAARRGTVLSDTQKKTLILLDIETRLQSFEKRLQDFGLPVPTEEEMREVSFITSIQPPVIREELQYDLEELSSNVEAIYPTFTDEQKQIYDTILDSVRSDTQVLIFISARGGSGKTYLLNGVLNGVRSLEPQGCIALAMATTGIAANLLNLGRTFHSRMKAPLKATKTSTLHIPAQSHLAKLIRMAKLLLLDEATIQDNLLFETWDRSLRDLMDCPDKPFGGKSIVLSGDFRQTLPIIPGASRAGIVDRCLPRSPLWSSFQVMQLTKNMRVLASGDQSLQEFDDWTLSLGNGDCDVLDVPQFMLATEIEPNNPGNSDAEANSMKEFAKKIFPDLEANISVPGWLDGRSILATTNKEVNTLNEVVSDLLPGNGILLKSSDQLENAQDSSRFNVEYLHSLTPSGFPPHCLLLKPNMPLMLLRNLDQKAGLCNGTKLTFLGMLDNRLLRCRTAAGKEVLIPRIVFIPKPEEYTFEWSRRMYPVKIAFSTTINKSQGQTLKYCGK